MSSYPIPNALLPIRKAVFPAAGLGTRFLPATKAQPKEMLPLVDKPTIQYGVEEAVASGVTNIILVTGRGKNAIEDHFDISTELEAFLESRGKHELLEEIRKISNLINVSYVRQGEPLGLGHAVLVTKALVGNEPFAVILGDDVIDADAAGAEADDRVFERAGGPVLAVERVPEDQVSSYGMIAGEPAPEFGPGVYRIIDMVEKPPREEAPSNLAIIGRYILTPDIFAALEDTAKDKSGEIQLTNGLRQLLKSRPIYAYEVDGVRHDTGNKLGFLKAMVYFALKRPELAGPFREYLEGLNLTSAVAALSSRLRSVELRLRVASSSRIFDSDFDSLRDFASRTSTRSMPSTTSRSDVRPIRSCSAASVPLVALAPRA